MTNWYIIIKLKLHKVLLIKYARDTRII